MYACACVFVHENGSNIMHGPIVGDRAPHPRAHESDGIGSCDTVSGSSPLPQRAIILFMDQLYVATTTTTTPSFPFILKPSVGGGVGDAGPSRPIGGVNPDGAFGHVFSVMKQMSKKCTADAGLED